MWLDYSQFLYLGALISDEEIYLIATIADNILEKDLFWKDLNEDVFTVTGDTAGLLVESGLKGVLVNSLMQ